MLRQTKITTLLLLTALIMSEGFGLVTPALAQDDASDIKGDISEVQKKLEKAEAKKAALEQQVKILNSSLYQTQRTITNTALKIKEAQNTIERKVAEIELLEAQTQEDKLLLAGLLQDLYTEGAPSLPEMFFSGESFTNVLNHPDHLLSVKEKIATLLESLETKHAQAATEKTSLETAKAEHEALLAKKTDEQQQLALDRNDTLDDVADQEATIEHLQKQLKELEGDLAVLTGKKYNAKDIRQAVEDASNETGVPKGVLYGFLKMETNLGANTGQCTYKEVEKVSLARYKKYGSKYKSSIALLYKRRDLFYDLVDTLGYSKDKKVSCSPSGYIGQGGAMGVAQFMSDVWMNYSSQITSKTGHKKPDPWNLTDGVMALAIKVRKAGATSDSSSAIRKASINYLGGFNKNYYSGIVYWAKNYKKLFD